MSLTVSALVLVAVGVLLGWAWPLPKAPSDDIDELIRAAKRRAWEDT